VTRFALRARKGNRQFNASFSALPGFKAAVVGAATATLPPVPAIDAIPVTELSRWGRSTQDLLDTLYRLTGPRELLGVSPSTGTDPSLECPLALLASGDVERAVENAEGELQGDFA